MAGMKLTKRDRDKYVVFKAEEWERWFDTIHDADAERCPADIEDGTVIRAQDIFAAPALHAYANSILVAKMIVESSPSVPSELREHLQGLADLFHERAVAAEQTDFRKLPD